MIHCESVMTSSVLRLIAPKNFRSKATLFISIAADNSMIVPDNEAKSNGIMGTVDSAQRRFTDLSSIHALSNEHIAIDLYVNSCFSLYSIYLM